MLILHVCTTHAPLQSASPENNDDRRRSRGGDGKYGFGGGPNERQNDPQMQQHQRQKNSHGGEVGASPQSSSMPPTFSPNRNGAPLSLPPTHSPQQQNAPPISQGRSPAQLGYPLPQGLPYSPNTNQVNGHSTDVAPEVPPKIDRTSKPGRVRSGHDFGSGKDLENDNNYINAGKGSSLERQNKVSFVIVFVCFIYL